MLKYDLKVRIFSFKDFSFEIFVTQFEEPSVHNSLTTFIMVYTHTDDSHEPIRSKNSASGCKISHRAIFFNRGFS